MRKNRNPFRGGLSWFAVAALGVLLMPTGVARAQNSLGGHIGLAFPLVTRAEGETTDIGDVFTTAVPMGITVKREGSRMAFDLELVPAVQDAPRDVSLTVHPGVVWDLGHGFAAGVRVAFVVDHPTFGFTPLVAKSWPISGHKNNAFFVELDLPVRFVTPADRGGFTAVSVALHLGTAF